MNERTYKVVYLDCSEQVEKLLVQAYEEGYEEGYSEGYDVAEEDYQEQCDKKMKERYQKGYDEGYQEGYNKGYLKGISSETNLATTNPMPANISTADGLYPSRQIGEITWTNNGSSEQRCVDAVSHINI